MRYVRSVTSCFWRSSRNVLKITKLEAAITEPHKRSWAFYEVQGIRKEQTMADGKTKISASTMATSSLFALAHCLFTNTKFSVADRRILETFLGMWVAKISDQEVAVTHFAPDGASYRY